MAASLPARSSLLFVAAAGGLLVGLVAGPVLGAATAPRPLYQPAPAADAIETIIDAALAHGKIAGTFCARPEDVGRWAAKGASFFILASDTMFLGAGVAGAAAAARATSGKSKRKG